MSRITSGLAVVVLALLIVACSGIVAGQLASTSRPPAATPTPAPDKASRPTRAPGAARPTPRPATPPPAAGDIPGLAELTGSDGRLTVLLLGSDAREGLDGERTDAIIVASIDPRTGKVAMVSLPRDTVNVPIAPGKVYPGRINGLLAEIERETGRRSVALKRFTEALSYAFDTEIDHYALVGFRGLERLVNAVGGVTVTLDDPLIDPGMHVGKRGLRLKAGDQLLDGRHALAFSRTRHTDNDYERARRQQQVVVAGAMKVLQRGATQLPALVALAREHLETDVPLTAAPALLALAGRARLGSAKSLVLAPMAFAAPGSVEYTTELRIDVVRRMFDRVFTPVGP